MRRRNKPVGKAAKTRSRRKVGRPTTAKIARPRKSSGVDTAKRIALLEHRLNEALEQQTASSEVLKVISSSPGELEPVFQAMLENATRICEAKFGTLFLREGGCLSRRCDLQRRHRPMSRRGTRASGPTTARHRLSAVSPCRNKLAQIADIRDDRGLHRARSAAFDASSSLAHRTVLAVPMLKDDELVGVIASTARRCGRSPTSRSSW